jgi:hypothetical protein
VSQGDSEKEVIKMATKHQVNKALQELGAELDQQPGKYHYDEFEVVAPEGKVWAGNMCSVLCYTYDKDMMTKAEFWDEVLTDLEEGLMDESEVE